ncbi:MAG: acyltransferase [Alphaproteobacteria bacterium]|nr:acyltransferase [Alphaproteobacteria bacterium]
MALFKKLIKIRGTGNQIISKKTKTNHLYKRSCIDITGDGNLIRIHEKNDIYRVRLVVNGSHNEITFDEGLRGFFFMVVSGSNIKVHIGKNCFFRDCEMAIFENGSTLEIGEGTMSARGSKLFVSDFHTIYDIETKQPLNKGTHLKIGNHVWIGDSSIVLKNHTIADNIVVAANSVVTKDLLESNAIYAGNPAILKKRNVNWDYRYYDQYVADLSAAGIAVALDQ